MSRLTPKRYFQSLSQEQLVGLVMEMYKNAKPAKEYLDFFMDPIFGL